MEPRFMVPVPVQISCTGYLVLESVRFCSAQKACTYAAFSSSERGNSAIYNKVRPVLAGPLKLFLSVIPERIGFNVSQALVPLA